MAMGAADVVPGVSGGTIAFISGIYEELIHTIDKLSIAIFTDWKTKGFSYVWRDYNLAFLSSLFLGIAISIFSLAKLISYLLDEHPIPLWSFFFGLIMASIIYIARQITTWNFAVILALLIGATIAFFITIVAPTDAPDSLFFFFLSGCIAIIAMILPGISGSFILVILGSYGIVLGALTDFLEGIFSLDWEKVKTNFIKVFIFSLGCLVGLKLFSKILKWMFTHQKNLTLALLTGFMIGSLNKVWPWKKVLTTRIDRHGDEVVVQSQSILPSQYQGDSLVLYAIVFAILGLLLILALEKFSKFKNDHT